MRSPRCLSSRENRENRCSRRALDEQRSTSLNAYFADVPKELCTLAVRSAAPARSQRALASGFCEHLQSHKGDPIGKELPVDQKHRLITTTASITTIIDSPSADPSKLPAPPSLLRVHKRRPRSSSSHDISVFPPTSNCKFLFTPAQIVPIATSRSRSTTALKSLPSSPLDTCPPPAYSARPELHTPLHEPEPYTSLPEPPLSIPLDMNSDTEEDDDLIYTTSSSRRNASSNSLRTRLFALASSTSLSTSHSRGQPKPICTTPGELCAGETETETDEPHRHLPTARKVPFSGPLVPPNTLQQRLTPLLFEFSRLLSIVPAIFGTLYNLYHFYSPPPLGSPERIDYFVSALWAILTGYQCLCLTTGLLTRWRLYYPPISTLVRLLALQGICWPATHLTLTILGHEKRPVVVWAVIGSTTSVSRSVQIWVTSNLWWDSKGGGGKEGGDTAVSATTTEGNRRDRKSVV